MNRSDKCEVAGCMEVANQKMRFASLDPPQVVAYCAEHVTWATERFPDGEVIIKDKREKKQEEDSGELFSDSSSATEELADVTGEDLAEDRRGFFDDDADEGEQVEDLGNLFAEEAPARGGANSTNGEERKGFAATADGQSRAAEENGKNQFLNAHSDGSITFMPYYTKQEADYRREGEANFDEDHKRCKSCAHFISGGGCHIVQGGVRAGDYCENFYADVGIYAHRRGISSEINLILWGWRYDWKLEVIDDFLNRLRDDLEEKSFGKILARGEPKNTTDTGGVKDEKDAGEDEIETLLREAEQSVYEHADQRAGETVDVDAEEIEVPGSGAKADARREAVMDLYTFLRREGTASKGDFLAIIDAHDVGYATAESFWSNIMKNDKYQPLRKLPGVEPPAEGEYSWRYVEPN